MARAAEAVTGEAEAPKRTRKASGPRKAKPTHVLFRVFDAQGNPIPGARLEIITATKDTDVFMDAFEQNSDATRARLQV